MINLSPCKHGRRSVLAGTAALGTSMLARRARAADPVSLAIVNTISDAPFFIGDAKGFFREEGLDVSLTNFSSGAQMISPLGVGQLDIGAGSVSATFYNANERNVSVRIVADKARNAPGYGFEAVLVRRDLMETGRFKDFADLKGLKVAIPSAASVGEQSILNEALKRGGLSYGDCQKVFLPTNDQLAAMRNGAIDATIVSEPTVSRTVQLGIARVFARVDTFYPDQEGAVVYFGDNILNRRPELGHRFMRAYLRAVRFYNDALAHGRIAGANAEEVIQIIARYSVIKEADVIRAATPSADDPDGRVNIPALAKDLAFIQQQGLVSRGMTVERTLDASFAQKAVEDLGPYRRA